LRAVNGLNYSQKIHFLSLCNRFGWSDSPTPCIDVPALATAAHADAPKA
jgi:hypothetical protein